MQKQEPRDHGNVNLLRPDYFRTSRRYQEGWELSGGLAANGLN